MNQPRITRRSAVGVTLAAVAVALTLYASGVSSGGTNPLGELPLASLATLGRLSPAPAAGPLGPEDVPVPAALQLARASAPAPGAAVDGIACEPLEQLAYHIHVHLTIFVDGSQRQIPYGIGIAPPFSVDRTALGAFVVSGACFSWLHTHAADGIVHIESPVERTYTLGQFFDIWRQPLGHARVGPATGVVTPFFDGRRYLGDPRSIPLIAHAQIQLDVGRPLTQPKSIDFPRGL